MNIESTAKQIMSAMQSDAFTQEACEKILTRWKGEAMSEAGLIVSASPDKTLTFRCGCCGSEELSVELAVERSSVSGGFIPAILKLKCFWCDTVYDANALSVDRALAF